MKLVSLNIEGHRHLRDNRLQPFLLEMQQDPEVQVVCLQEVFAADLPLLSELLAMEAIHAPMTQVVVENVHLPDLLGVLGVAIFTRLPVLQSDQSIYSQDWSELPRFMVDGDENSLWRTLLWAELQYQQQQLRVATTHFTWSPRGEYTALQQRDSEQLFSALDQVRPDVLVGDFNSPRILGTDTVFSALAERMDDNVPQDVQSTLDPELHKAGPGVQLVVDGFFTGQRVAVPSVTAVTGVSDHVALIGEVFPSSSECGRSGGAHS